MQYLVVIIFGLFSFLGFLPGEALANRAFNGTVYNYLGTPVQGVNVEIWGVLDHCDEQLAENPQACDHRFITSMLTGSDGKFVGGVGCEWLDLKYSVPNYAIPISDFGGEDECGNNSCYTAGTIRLPEPKSCQVTVAPDNAPEGNPMTITYSSRGWNGSENSRLLITKQDFGPFTGSSGSSGNYYKVLKDNCPANTSCTVTTPTDLPQGIYYAHCDLPTDPGKCSGARVCGDGSGYSDLGGICGGWKSCGNGDYASFSVATCPPPPPGTSPQVRGLQAQPGIYANLGQFRISGLRGQQGSNFNNELTITAYGKAGDRPVQRIYAVFYNQEAFPNGLTNDTQGFQDVLNRISTSPKDGFILAYGVNINGNTEDDWFVRDRNGWRSLPEARSQTGDVYDGPIVYTVWGDLKSSKLESGQAGWNVEFQPGFDSKDMNTAVYLEDGVNVPAFKASVPTNPDPPVTVLGGDGCPI